MERTLYLNETFCAVSEDGRLTEYLPIREEEAAGRILTGRVDRMMTGLDAAFVDIGRKKDGFLPLRENSQTFTGSRLRSGDRVLVQIRKEETGSKGAFLTRDLSIPGSFLILMPMNRHIGVSARVKDGDTRDRLLQTGRELAGESFPLVMEEKTAMLPETAPQGEPAGRQFGLVMREASASVSVSQLRDELEQLLKRWQQIQAGENSTESVAEELIRDYTPRGIGQILCDTPLPPDLERQRKEADLRVIRLPHGGNIVIDRCEAMTVIDVNSASDPGDGRRRETVLRTNLEACREIMIQVRLRNLCGILILDLIDMECAEDRDRVRQALEEAFRQDRIKTVIHGYTSLGLMEMTRRRTRSTPAREAGRE